MSGPDCLSRLAHALLALVVLMPLGHAQRRDLLEPTPQQWRADIDHLWEQLDQVHVDPFHHVSRAELRRAFDALVARSEQAERHEMIVGIAQLVAMLGPGRGRDETAPALTGPQWPLVVVV